MPCKYKHIMPYNCKLIMVFHYKHIMHYVEQLV